MRIKKFAAMMLAAVAAAGIVACEKDSDSPQTPEPDPQPAVIGTYTFGDTEYDIRFASVYDDGYNCSFIFSPLSERPLTTYLAVALGNYFMGSEVDVTQIYHNDDYSFVYEDPLHFYSRFRALRSGTMLIKRNNDDNYTVNVDVLLADGTPVRMNFTGDVFREEE